MFESCLRTLWKLKIQECNIFDNISKDASKQGIPIGVFRCDCGFTYQRLGPDKSEKDKFTYSLVREYGEVWENKFKKLWADLSLSLWQIGKQLGISQTSVGRQAIRLKLPMNTETTRSLHGYKRHRNPNKSFSEMRQTYRDEWLKVWRNHPNLNRTQLVNTENFLYLWLKRNDSEWFEVHLPVQTMAGVKRERLNWRQIDKDLSKKIEMVCREISDSKEFPVRISITEIIRRVGHKVWIDKRLRKLPNTPKIIDKNLETLEDFMLRKIKWTTKHFIRIKKTPSLIHFKVRAVVRNGTSNNSQTIQQAIESALVEIEKSVNSI